MASDAVDLLLDFLNTTDVASGFDVFAADGAWTAWARERRLSPGDPEAARNVRDALRAALTPAGTGAQSDGTPSPDHHDLSEVLTRSLPPLHTTWTPAGLTLSGMPGPYGPDAVGEALAGAVVLQAQGRLHRVKICPGDDCGWAFFDRSRNASRTWCSMAVCGNRSKTKSFRHRHAEEGWPPPAGAAPQTPF
jgi:predicted RNA-binding Zn ribbon-like protein